MTEFRKHGRSPLPGRVTLKHREWGEISVEDGDISATGLFLKIRSGGALSMTIGDELAAELPQAANEVFAETRVRVVRVTNDGIGLTFM